MRGVVAGAAVVALLGLTAAVAFPAGAGAVPSQAERWIVVLEDGVADPGAVGAEHASGHGAVLDAVYSHALRGYAATMPAAAAAQIANDPRVAYVEPDRVFTIAAQTLPTGVNRIEADQSPVATVDGIDDAVDVDIAIIDTGMDEDHPDLRIVGGWNCVSLFNLGCFEGGYEDGHGHGTHVAGIAAAIDNGFGAVGVAPGARLWAVAVLDDNGGGALSWILAGIDKVAENAATIEVANMSFGAAGYVQSMRDAVAGAVAKGVVFTAAAGNSAKDVYGADGLLGTSDDFVPAAFPEVSAVSAMADSDGGAGGTGPVTSYGPDDSFASFSNFSRSVVAGGAVSPGKAIDLLLPGVNIYSTHRFGGYATMSGTSMASPHGAGLAGLYIAHNGRASTAAGVVAIRQALIDGGAAQSDAARGLTTQNDPDANLENIGWAGSSAPPDPSNNPPDATNVSATGSEDAASIAWTPSVSDPDLDPLSCTVASQPAHGSAAVTADCSGGTYTPAANWNGVDSFTYRVSDGRGGTDTATVTATVDPVNDAPVATNDAATTSVGSPVAVSVLGNDTDADGNTLTVSGLTQPANGTAVLNADQSVTYTPNAGFSGLDSFTYAPHDGTVAGNTATVTIDVKTTATKATVNSITYRWAGGKDGKRDLYIDVLVLDDLAKPVVNASVSIALNNNGLPIGTATGPTNSSGVAKFKASRAPKGCYTTTVTNVVVAGLTWDGNTPANGPACK